MDWATGLEDSDSTSKIMTITAQDDRFGLGSARNIMDQKGSRYGFGRTFRVLPFVTQRRVLRAIYES